MSYETVLAGLHVRFATVSGIKKILDFVPAGAPEPPFLYSALDRFEIVRSGQVKATRYYINHTLCFRWQDNERAEEELLPFVNSIPDAVDADPHLGGVLTAGYAEITDGEARWLTIGSTEYRIIEFHSVVTEK
jgi:hypothetical protein